MGDLKTALELVAKYPPLLVLGVGLALWVGKGAFFAWHEGYTKFRNRRITDARELAQLLTPVAPSMGAALTEELESAVFIRFVGVRVARVKRIAAIALFEGAGEPVQFGLLRSAWSYLILDGDRLVVKRLDGPRHWRHVTFNVLFALSAACAVALFVLTGVFWSKDRPLALVGAIEIPGFLFICSQLLLSIWAYRDAKELDRISRLPRVQAASPVPSQPSGAPAASGGDDSRPGLLAGLGGPPLALPSDSRISASNGAPARQRQREDV